MAIFDINRNGARLRLDVHVDPKAIAQCVSAARSFSFTGSRPKDWQLQFYRIFLQHTSTQMISRAVLSALDLEVSGLDEQVEWLVAWVQEGIAYDFARAGSSMSDGLQYPVETVTKAKGVCADKSLLLAAVLLEMGFGVCFFTFERANHIAVGIEVPAGFGSYGSEFAFIETTDSRPIGLIPEKMAGGVRLDGRPEVIVLGRGKKFEAIQRIQADLKEGVRELGKDFVYMSSAQQEIKREMHALQTRMDQLKPQLKGCSGTLPPDRFHTCQKLNSEYNQLVASYNALVAKFNAANR